MADQDTPGSRPMKARRHFLGLAIAAAVALALLLGYRYFVPPSPALRPPAGAAPLAVGADRAAAPAEELLPGIRMSAQCATDGSTFDSAAVAPAQLANDKALRSRAQELAAGTAPAERALGLYVQLANAQSDAHAAFASQNPQCLDAASCGAREDQAVALATHGTRDALARLAATSSDGPAYYLAYMACGAVESAIDKGECAQISARQWARIEPDNAQPWLFVAGEAARPAEAALLADALFHASRARYSDSHGSVFSMLPGGASPHGKAVAPRDGLVFAAFGLAAATRYAPYQPLFSYCSVEALADPNRRQVCDDLAQMLTERSDSTVSLTVGAKLGERLGWPQDRVDGSRNRRDAYYQISTDRIGEGPGDCASMAKRRAWVEEILVHGELGAEQREIAASGTSVVELARRRREAVHRQLESAATREQPAAGPGTPQ